MSLSRFPRLALIACLVLGMSPALAGTLTTPMQVNMQVNASCQVSTVQNLSFGQYNTAQAQATDALALVAVSCVSNTPNVSIFLDQGQHPAPGSTCAAPARRMHLSGGHYLAYHIYSDAARTIPRGCEPGVNVQEIPASSFTTNATVVYVSQYGRIPAGQDPMLSASSYTDVVGVTISF